MDDFGQRCVDRDEAIEYWPAAFRGVLIVGAALACWAPVAWLAF